MKKILSFKDGKQELILYFDNKKLVYAKRENKEISFDLAKEEIKLLKQVLAKFLPSKALIPIGKVKLKNKEYKHLFDYESGRHYFYYQDKLPSLKDYRVLERIYNRQKKACYVEIEEDNDDELDYDIEDEMEERKVVIGKKILLVSFSVVLIYILNLLLSIYGPDSYEAFRYQARTKVISAVEDSLREVIAGDITSDEIKEALINNSHLTEEEKAFYMENIEFYEDQAPYIDKSDFLDTLQNLDIKYLESAYEIKSILGNWDQNYLIRMYQVKDFSQTFKPNLRHELLHTESQKKAISDSRNYFISPFYETLNKVMNNEYSYSLDNSSQDSSYYWLEKYFYRIAKLFSTETLRKFHAVPKHEYLIAELVGIIKDVDKAYQLFNTLYEYDCAYKAVNINDKELLKIKSIAEWQEMLLKAEEKLNLLIQDYYEVKFQKELEKGEDLELIYLYSDKVALTLIKRELNYHEDLDYLLTNTRLLSWPTLFNERMESKFRLLIPKKISEITDSTGELIEVEEAHDYYLEYDLAKRVVVEVHQKSSK